MRFALLGLHPDGVELARFLVESGRHQLLICTEPLLEAPPALAGAQRVSDLEEILANPAIEAVIVASPAEQRAVHLRRALQSERHVLCVWPPDDTPDIAYEAALIQKDTGCLLLPILTEGLHPAVLRLAALVGPAHDGAAPLGSPRLLEVERSEPGPVLLNTSVAGQKPTFPGWDVLRRIGGEIVEVSGFARGEEVPADEPVLIAGRFQQGCLFSATLLPEQPARVFRLTVLASEGQAELTFSSGFQGAASLVWQERSGRRSEETWPPWLPWPTLVETFEAALSAPSSPTPHADVALGHRPAPAGSTAIQTGPVLARPGDSETQAIRSDWQDCIRALELDDAARRSIEKRRSSLLEYPEASEEVGFKGTMTLVGCGLLWAVILMLFLARWVPGAGVLIFVLLAGFLGMQLFRFLIPRKPSG